MIRVVVADDHGIVREGLCSLLKSESDIEVVGEAENGNEAVELCKKLNPDVVVMDYEMPELDGLEATRRISTLGLKTKVLVLTMYDRDDFAKRFIDAGASGYLPKKTTFKELPLAVRKVASGSVYITVSSTHHNVDSTHSNDPDKELSEREFQVFIKLAKGEELKDIADELGLGYSTVRTYKARILEKLELRNSSDITRLAMSRGLIPGS